MKFIVMAAVFAHVIASSAFGAELEFRPVVDPKNPDRFICVDANGDEGYNKISVEELISTKIGYCARFGGITIESGTDLKNADFRGSDFIRGELSYVNMEGADFRSARIMMVDAYGINLQGADLTGAEFSNSTISRADLRNIKMDGTSSSLRGSMLVNTDLSGAKLDGVNLAGVMLLGPYASLKDASLVGADLSFSKFVDEAYGYAVNTEGANFSNAIYNSYTALPFTKEEASTRGMVYQEL